MEDTTSKATTFESQNVSKKQKENIFSQPWNKSDVVLVVDDKEFHVHRSMLSMQSPVFDALFNRSGYSYWNSTPILVCYSYCNGNISCNCRRNIRLFRFL